MNGIGKFLILSGVILIFVGAIFVVGEKFGLGKLPGDISVKRENFSFHFPIVSSIIISILLTVILNIFFRR